MMESSDLPPRLRACTAPPHELEACADVKKLTHRDLVELLSIDADDWPEKQQLSVGSYRHILHDPRCVSIVARGVTMSMPSFKNWDGRVWSVCPSLSSFTGRTWKENPGRRGRPPSNRHVVGYLRGERFEDEEGRLKDLTGVTIKELVTDRSVDKDTVERFLIRALQERHEELRWDYLKVLVSAFSDDRIFYEDAGFSVYRTRMNRCSMLWMPPAKNTTPKTAT